MVVCRRSNVGDDLDGRIKDKDVYITESVGCGIIRRAIMTSLEIRNTYASVIRFEKKKQRFERRCARMTMRINNRTILLL